MWVTDTATDCVDWTYLPFYRSENKPTNETRKPPQKKQKFPRYLKNPKNLKSSEKNENHAVGYSKNQQHGKNSEKKFRTNEGDFRCVPKKNQ